MCTLATDPVTGLARLDGPTQQQLLKAAGQEIEAEAAQFHKAAREGHVVRPRRSKHDGNVACQPAKFTKGVALMRLSLAQIDLQWGTPGDRGDVSPMAGHP
eukprot:Skav201095  [mRNA]  locus=scaffold2562:297709:300135:+ [translate_table: standard]